MPSESPQSKGQRTMARYNLSVSNPLRAMSLHQLRLIELNVKQKILKKK